MKPNKTKLIRISFIVAILCSAATATLNLAKLKHEIKHIQSDLKETKAARNKSETALSAAKQNAKTTSIALQNAETALQARTAEAGEQTKRARQLANDVARVSKQRDEAQADLATYRTMLSAEDAARVSTEFKKLRNELAAVQEENRILGRRLVKMQRVIHEEPDIFTLPAALRCKVLVCDPKWSFVVIDAGEDQGMLERAELLVARNGALVGKVRAVRVEKNRCIANLIPGWQLGDVHEGDILIPAYPES